MYSRMLKYALFVACFFCLLPAVTKAEDEPRMEVFTGYSYMKSNHSGSELKNFNGLNISATANLMKHLGITFDYSFHRDSDDLAIGVPPHTVGGKQSASYNTFLVGPTVKMRHEYFEPFAHALVGAVKSDQSLKVRGSSFDRDNTAFAFALGGGFDIKVHKNISIRAAQIDYMFYGSAASLDGNKDNNVRLSSGVLFTF